MFKLCSADTKSKKNYKNKLFAVLSQTKINMRKFTKIRKNSKSQFHNLNEKKPGFN